MLRNTILPALFFALAALAPQGASAQAPAAPFPEPGARVHVSVHELESRREYTGTLLEAGTDSLLLRPDGDTVPVKVSHARLRRMEVFEGYMSRERTALRNGLVGAGAGIVLGGVLGAVTNDRRSQPGELISFSRGETAVMGAVLGGGVLGATGLVLGLLNPDEQWRRVDLPESTSLRVSGADGGMALSVSVKL